jgi:hypothetical protein
MLLYFFPVSSHQLAFNVKAISPQISGIIKIGCAGIEILSNGVLSNSIHHETDGGRGSWNRASVGWWAVEQVAGGRLPAWSELLMTGV